MIFLFDKFKKLKGTVRNRHTISLLYERERNGLYTVAAEIPLKITDKKTVYNYHKKVKDSDFLGHYDREGRFQLHKIASVDIEDSSIYIKGVHLFFDEAKAGAIIQERRFRDREIIDGARVAFDSIGWSVVDFDVSDTEDYIFYNVSPLEARAILVETFGFEFDYWLDFDGKNIRNKQISVKREMGKDSNKRYNYGHNVLNIKVEQDYSEIYTAVIGRGKGEDLGDDAYGRRIEYTDVEWKTPSNPMNKPKGSRVLHDENATQLFGYHENGKVSPRTKVEIFEDIEDPAKLLRASYNWLRENSVPKAVFSLKVPDGDGLDLGDKVHVIYRDIDLVKHTRVTKVVDDLVSGNRDVEFGDTAYFKTDRRLSGVKSELKRVGGSMSSRISRLKTEFDRRFDNEVQQWKDDFEQAVIDAEAEVEAMRVTMTEEFEAAQNAFEEEFNQSVADAKKHADEQAEAKAKKVQDNLDSFAGRHEQIVGELQGRVVDVDGELAETRADVLETLGRLTVVDGSISGIKGSLTEIEGTLTNTKTQLETQITDARTDLEKSISSTRTALENKIDTTEEALNKVGEDLGNAKTDLQNQLDDARAELAALEVGGRNLLPAFTSDKWTHTNLTEVEEYSLYFPTGHAGNSILFMDVEKNTNYTMTFNSDYARYYIYEVLEDGSLGSIIRTRTGSETYTFNTEDISRIRVSINTFSGNVQEEKNIWNMQLEKGTVATDWTPSPEDTDNKITNINQTITNIEGELSTKVEQTEVDALRGTVTTQGTLLTQTAEEVSSKAEKSVVDTLTGRVANTESSVTQNAEEIAKRLTKSVYDSDKKATDAKITQWSNTASETAEGLTRVIGRVSETEKGIDTAQTRIEAEAGRVDGVLSRTSKVEGQVQDAQLAIEANADGLALRATKTEVEQAIDGIEVGGRNYLKSLTNNSLNQYRDVVIADGVIYWTQKSAATAPFTIPTYAPDETKTYTFSFKTDTLENIRNIINSPKSGSKWVDLKHKEFADHYLAWLTVENFNANGSISFYGGNPFNPVKEVKFWDLKLELGNKATDWTPAPEDIDASLSEVTDRVTTAEAEIKVHAGEISQKATQSELDRVTGRVSTAETSITQNATEISRRLVKSDYDSDKQATDAEITKWSNLTSETAEGLEQTISRVTSTEGEMSKAQADIIANADEIATKVSITEFNNLSGKVSDNTSAVTQNAKEIALKASQSSVNTLTGEVNSLESQLSIQADEIRGVVADTNSLGAQVSDLRLASDKFSVTIGELETDLTEKINGVDTWHYNMLRGTRFDEGYWEGTDMEMVDDDINYFEFEPSRNNSYIPRIQTTQEVYFSKNETYTLSFDFQTYAVRQVNYIWLIATEDETEPNTSIWSEHRVIESTHLHTHWGKDFNRYYLKFKPIRSMRAYLRIGVNLHENGDYGRRGVKFRLPYLTTTDNTRWLYHQLDSNQNIEEVTRRISKIEQTTESIDLMVAEINDTAVRQSEIFVGSSGIQIGATYIGDSQLASILEVSPRSIDVITDNMNLTGNLNVKGQIESISMSAVKADFADLFAARVRAGDVDIDNISGRTAWFERLYTLNANIDRLTSQFAFIDEVKALSISAVEANIGSIRSQILTSNVVQSKHIASGTALIDKIFSSTAMFERMMSKSAFVRTLNTVSIDTDQLTIRRADGGVLMSNGTQKFGSPIITKAFPESGVDFDGVNYSTTLRSSKTFERAYGEHAGRWANFSFRIGLDWSAYSASTYMRVVIRPGNTPSGVSIPTVNERFIVYRGQQRSETVNVRLPVPTFGAISWTLEFYREGNNVNNPITIRSERCWISA